MNKTVKFMTTTVLFTALISGSVLAHCQIPCGIYDDAMRIEMMEEHVTTIEKSIKEIEAGPNPNQTVRWVMNKEHHANELSDIVTYYFMAQRIKPDMEGYTEKLSQLHEMLVHAMKAKQTTDMANVKKLRELIHQFEHSYLGADAGHKH